LTDDSGSPICDTSNYEYYTRSDAGAGIGSDGAGNTTNNTRASNAPLNSRGGNNVHMNDQVCD
jgi:hypothetical protein